MKRLQLTFLAVAIVISLSSNALAGNIAAPRSQEMSISGNIAAPLTVEASATGNIAMRSSEQPSDSFSTALFGNIAMWATFIIGGSPILP